MPRNPETRLLVTCTRFESRISCIWNNIANNCTTNFRTIQWLIPPGSEEVIVALMAKMFSEFYGTRRLIIVFVTVRHWSATWGSWIQSRESYPILTLSYHLRLALPSGLSFQVSPTKNVYTYFISPKRTTCPAHPILLYLTILILFSGQVLIMKNTISSSEQLAVFFYVSLSLHYASSA
jgi:hypothetical protein